MAPYTRVHRNGCSDSHPRMYTANVQSMARGPVQLGNLSFPSRAAAQTKVRELVARNSLDAPLQGDDLALADALLRAHQQVEYKLRHGLSGIVVKIADGHSTRCLAVIGLGGEKEEFSWRVALRLQPCVPVLGAAARTAVNESISDFRRSAFAAGPVTCPIMGTLIFFQDAHVDHARPWTFDEIVKVFVAENGEPELKHEGNRDRFASEAVAVKFRNWHDKKARLRVVHRTANLSVLRRRD